MSVAVKVTYARAVLPACERVDLHKLLTFFGESLEVRLATELELADLSAFELGACRHRRTERRRRDRRPATRRERVDRVRGRNVRVGKPTVEDQI